MTKPYPFQKAGVKWIKFFDGRALLADEMGLGKTFQALLYANEVKASPIVVVCPAHLKYNWQNEARRHMGKRSEVLEGKKVPRRRFVTHDLIIVNYDILASWLPFIQEHIRPKLVILDECHYIKNSSTKRAKATKTLCRGVKQIIGISGTPITNRPIEFYTILKILRPELFKNKHTFGQRYCGARRTRWGWEYKGAVRVKELHELLTSECMIRRLKRDVMKELPKQTRIVLPMDLSSRSEYDEARADFVKWARKTMGSVKASFLARIERAQRMGFLLRLTAKLKLPSVFEWVDNWLMENDGKLILFGHHKSILRALRDRYESQAVLVTGSVRGRARQRAVDQFTTNKRTRLFIGQRLAAGTGWNGTVSQTVAHVELGWDPAQHDQADMRVDRIGQKLPTSAYYFVAHDSIEEELCQLLHRKQRVLDAALNGKLTATQQGKAGSGENLWEELCQLLTTQKKNSTGTKNSHGVCGATSPKRR